jgi:cytochrome P450
MHRDASVFLSPDTFLPDRWLDAEGQNAEELGRMSQNMMPFGTGSRVWGGQNLAQVMLKVAVAAVARNFDDVAPSETNERTMEMKDSFVSSCSHFGRFVMIAVIVLFVLCLRISLSCLVD